MKKYFVFLLAFTLFGSLVFSQSIRVIEPRNNAEYILGEMFPIKWQKSGLKNPVRIVLKRNGITLGEIARLKDPHITNFPWRVGKHSRGMAPAGGKYRIMVQEIGYQGNGVAAMSPGTFSLRENRMVGTEIVLDPGKVVSEDNRNYGTEIVLDPDAVIEKDFYNVTIIDFQVTKGGGNIINFKTDYRPDLLFTVLFRVKNTGTKKTPPIYWDLNYWTVSIKSSPRYVSGVIPPLNPGQEWSKAQTGHLRKNFYSLQLVIDSTSAIKESDEKDNKSQVFHLSSLN